MYAHVTVITPLPSFTMSSADLLRLADELDAQLRTAVPGAEVFVVNDGSTLWAGERGLIEGPDALSPYWPAVQATRAAVLRVLGDGCVLLGHIGPCDELPPPLL